MELLKIVELTYTFHNPISSLLEAPWAVLKLWRACCAICRLATNEGVKAVYISPRSMRASFSASDIFSIVPRLMLCKSGFVWGELRCGKIVQIVKLALNPGDTCDKNIKI